MTQRVLTGITTSGTPHLGNYVGAIRPAIAASREPGVESFLFLADYHALIKCDEPARIERSRLEIAATWLAAGLDPERVTFYRQSDIVEIPELTWLLTCVASKGLMNRAHAYKAAADANLAAGEDVDAGITMGLFSYPILMAADILMFNAHQVPVGRDQVQHIEMARDLAQRFNHLFGAGRELFVLPEAAVDERVAMLPGLDGRKMSKSYDNTVPLFAGGAAGLRDAIARVVTDSRAPGEPKEPEGSHLVAIFEAFASDAERAAFRAALRAGMAWGDAKAQVVERIERDIGPLRARYAELIAHPERVEEVLLDGARRARAVAAPFLATLREAVGLRRMVAVAAPAAAAAAATNAKPALATFKQYREADGTFFFKLVGADGRLLLQSLAFASGREAGQCIAALKARGVAAVPDAPVAHAEGVSAQDVADALAALQEAEAGRPATA
ncbi:MAG TPA: tryptophan--tRNA ligase [Burkholderiaceae bacterium]|nr:tryptophan--tRNA ligase [Burkholderiaceae bacterium]